MPTSAAFAQRVTLLQDSLPYLLHGGQGYLGVTLGDIDNDRSVALKLKHIKGAEIVTVDHDAPAGKAGLQPGDVVLQLNGQAVEGAEQMRRMLRETPPGRSVNLLVSRDGQQSNHTVQLVDRHDLERQVWGKQVNPPEPEGGLPSNSLLNDRGPGFRGLTDGWGSGGSSLSVGAVVDPLGPQLASFFGVSEGVGLLVKDVQHKSLAAAAGLKAGDVVLKVNDDTMATRADWQRILRANEGKQVQLTVVRDKKQQQFSMQAGNSRKKGSLEMPYLPSLDLSSAEMQGMVAELNDVRDRLGFSPADLAAETREATRAIDMDAVRAQGEQAMKSMDFNALRQQLQEAQVATKNIDVEAIRTQVQRQMEELKKQLDESTPQ